MYLFTHLFQLINWLIDWFVYLFIFVIGLAVILRKSQYLASQLVDLVLLCCFCPRWPAVCTGALSCRVERQWLCQQCWKKMKLNCEQGKAGASKQFLTLCKIILCMVFRSWYLIKSLMVYRNFKAYLIIGSCFSVHYRVMEHTGSLESTKEA